MIFPFSENKNIEENSIFWLASFWFKTLLELNTDKFHWLVWAKYEHSWAKIGDNKICESNEVKLLGVTVHNKLKFGSHMANICFKVNQQLSVLSRLARLLFFEKKQFFKALFESQLEFCPLSWMSCNRRANNKINKLHEGALRLAYNDYETLFSDLVYYSKRWMVHLLSTIQIFKRSYLKCIK